MFRTLAVLLATVFTATGPAQAEPSAPPPAEAGRLVAITDQDYDNASAARIRLMDPRVANWSAPAAQKWTWHPTSANGFGGLTSAWGLPTDVKLRRKAGAYVALVSDSRGLAGLITYPGGRRLWAADVGAPNNPHSVELLPDGNVAVAASTGGFVRIYTASQGSGSTTSVTYPLHDAHGVHWDPARKVLWALGGDKLAALRIVGTPAAPIVEESKVFTLPTGGGHDLAPALENRDLLWVSTGTKVYRFSKSAGRVVAAFDLPKIKSVSSMPNAQQVRTTPKSGCRTSWCTDTVDFAVPAATRTLPGAEIYKARVWSSRYE
ncbi:DUF6528 family protein [Kribbella sp. CA-247076]|uniref:DUF6528 family protein n=1 Tax=Kribbella sp. CA-247076 TaxID=3239941 RepID=UPI003D9076A5